METLNAREKVIIAVFGPANRGKSTAIMELANRFPFEPKFEIVYPKEDTTEPASDFVCKGPFTSELTCKKITVGICSFGDYKSILEEFFLPLVINDKCNVIVVACHNLAEVDGNTFNYIDEIAIANGYRLISTSILNDEYARWEKIGVPTKCVNSVNMVNGVSINEIFADNMINLIKSIA